MNKSDKLFMETAEKQQKIIDILLEACKEAQYALKKENYKEPDGVMYLLNNAIKQAE